MAVRLGKRGGDEALGVGVTQVDDLRVLSHGPTDRSPARSYRRIAHNDEERRRRPSVALLPDGADRGRVRPRLGGPVSDF